MMLELAERYYRLALSKAARRELSDAIRFARYACEFNENHEKAARLLALCLHELGELSVGSEDEFKRISAAAQQKKWRQAMRLAKALPHRNVRELNIQGCVYACAKKYREAARAFAEALEKDRGNKLALAGLAEATKRRRTINPPTPSR